MVFWINEEHIMVDENDDETNLLLGQTGFYEVNALVTLGELFRDLRSRFGRCTGKVYIDTKDGTKAIGWVFRRRTTPGDYLEGEPHLCDQWISVLKSEPRTIYDYAEVG